MTTTSTTASIKGLDLRAAIWAGLIAGAVFMMMEMIFVAVMGESPWGPPRMMAAMVMGKSVLPPPATFGLAIFIVAMIVHFLLSLALALAFGWAVSRRHLSLGVTLTLGAAFGLLISLVNFYPVSVVRNGPKLGDD